MASRPSLAAGSSATSSAATATSMPRSSSRVAIVRHPPAPSHCVRAPGHFEGCCGNCEWPDYARQCSYHGRDGPILHIIRRLRLYECQYSHWLVYNFTNLVSATFSASPGEERGRLWREAPVAGGPEDRAREITRQTAKMSNANPTVVAPPSVPSPPLIGFLKQFPRRIATAITPPPLPGRLLWLNLLRCSPAVSRVGEMASPSMPQ